MSTITTVTGIIAPGDDPLHPEAAIDYAGAFGPIGANLAGDAYTVTWTTVDTTNCQCSFLEGGSLSGTPNPVLDAVLTINGHSFDFGAGVSGYVALGVKDAIFPQEDEVYVDAAATTQLITAVTVIEFKY
jgi:hypothetical protein